MRALNGFCIAALCATGSFAQFRGGATPYISGGFPSVVFPGGTPQNFPGVTRFPYNPVFPAGGGPRLKVPFSFNFKNSYRGTGGVIYSYPYPVYVGNYGDSGGGYGDPSMQGPPPEAAPASPVIINLGGPGPGGPPPPGVAGAPPYGPEQPQPPAEEPSPEPAHYLIALRDHTIYSALAYWVDGTTLHYFTSGNIHNQVSLSLVDRDLTERLNKETGMPMNLPK